MEASAILFLVSGRDAWEGKLEKGRLYLKNLTTETYNRGTKSSQSSGSLLSLGSFLNLISVSL